VNPAAKSGSSLNLAGGPAANETTGSELSQNWPYIQEEAMNVSYNDFGEAVLAFEGLLRARLKGTLSSKPIVWV